MANYSIWLITLHSWPVSSSNNSLEQFCHRTPPSCRCSTKQKHLHRLKQKAEKHWDFERKMLPVLSFATSIQALNIYMGLCIKTPAEVHGPKQVCFGTSNPKDQKVISEKAFKVRAFCPAWQIQSKQRNNQLAKPVLLSAQTWDWQGFRPSLARRSARV